MRKKNTWIVLVLSFMMLFSFAFEKEVMGGEVVEKDQIVTPVADDVIPDPILNWVIRCEKKKTPDGRYAKLTQEDLLKLPVIYYSEGDHWDLYDFNIFIESIEGIQYATDTEQVILPYNKRISDLSPMANMVKLRKIILNCNNISDITPLSNLTNVTQIHLGDNKLTTLEPLSNMTKLESLNVELNYEISDISAIKNFSKLKYLNLGTNNISNITPLRNLQDLEIAILTKNKISDISGLANKNNLEELDLSSNNISDISVLKELRNLKVLRLSNNSGIKDIGPLTNLTKLNKDELWLAGTGIADKKDDLFKVIGVNKLINKFKANEITIEDKENVAEARKAFDSLLPELKEYILELRITAAEENIGRLENGELIKRYSELSEFDELPIEPGDIKTLKVKVVDKSGQPLNGVNFDINTVFGGTISSVSSNEQGILEYNTDYYDRNEKYKVELADKDKYTSNIKEITFKMGEAVNIDDGANIIEINDQPITGKEDLKFVLTKVEGKIEIENLTKVKEFKLGNDAKITIKAVNLSKKDENVTLIVALYNKDGEFENYSSSNQFLKSGQESQLESTIKLPKEGEHILKVFIWDDFKKMIPFSQPINFSVVK